MSTLYNFAIPEGWTLIQSGVAHPSDEFAKGDLCRFDSTGRYCLFCGQVARNVPQPWARKLDPNYTDGRLTVDAETRGARAKAGAAARWQPLKMTVDVSCGSVDELRTILRRLNRRYYAITPDNAEHTHGTFTVGGNLSISGNWRVV